MKLNNLRPAQGATHSQKRLARGVGSGTGRTAGRGNNGAGQRSGAKLKRAHEGGQMPLQMRMPKRGFKNSHRRYKTYTQASFQSVNLDTLSQLAETHKLSVIDAETLCRLGVLHKGEQFKVLARGEMKQAVEVIANRFSATAKDAIAQTGGKSYVVVKLNQLQGIASHRNFQRLNLETIYGALSYLNEGDLICVVPEGELTLKFDIAVHKIAPAAKAQLEAKGGQVTIVA